MDFKMRKRNRNAQMKETKLIEKGGLPYIKHYFK